jgi:hypothetical protein
MQSSVLERCLPHAVVIDYGLLPSLNSPRADGEDEPIAVCTVRLVRTDTLCEERPLAAWHFPPSGRPILMPIEETGESTGEIYAGRFLLLPRRDLTLVLVDVQSGQQSLVQLRLAPNESRRGEGGGGLSAWRVFVVWSDGAEIDLQRGGSAPFIANVGGLYLSDAQCSAFVQLGGLLHTEERAGHGSAARRAPSHNLSWVGDGAGKPGFALHTHAASQEEAQVSSCSISRTFRVAVERGRIVLSDCWLQLPVTCQGCLQPVVGEIAPIETLWGKMHAGCAHEEPRQVNGCERAAEAPVGERRASANASQLVLPGVVG